MVTPTLHARGTTGVRRLPSVATWLCGDSAGQRVFEPLIADWDRELRQSRTPTARAAVVVSGLLAFMSTLVACGLRHALTEETGVWKHSLIAIATATGLGIASEMAIVDARATGADFPPDVLLMVALRVAGAAAIAPAMLPALFLLQRGPRTTQATATRWIAGGALVAALATVSIPSPENYQLTADQNERMYQRALANDRAGRYQYPGTVARQLREPSTPETRRASYERFLTQSERWRAERPAPTPWQRLRRSPAPLLAVLFGVIGWSLGGVVQVTLARAIVWWSVAWFAMLATDGRLAALFRVANFQRLPWWALPAAAGSAAAALALASTRRHRGTGAPAPTR